MNYAKFEVIIMKLNIKAFILGLILSAGLIAAKNIYSCELSAQIDKGIYRSAKIGTIEKLYIGSSMFRQGIDIHEAAEFCEDTFLLAYNGFDPANEYLVLSYLVNQRVPIKTVYLDMYAYSAAKESWLAESRMMFDSPLSLKLSLWNIIKHNTNADLPSAAYELFISSGNDMFILWPLYRKLVSSRYCKGGAALGSYSSGTTREKLSLTPVPDSGSARMNPDQKQAVIRIIDLCRANNIELIFIETPKYYDVIENKAYVGIMSEYIDLMNTTGTQCFISRQTLRQIGQDKSSTITVYDFPHEEPELFADHIHLSSRGSKKFTSLLSSQ